ncbi:MAG: aspartyl protease family protein [Gemmatimonadales bacterium]
MASLATLLAACAQTPPVVGTTPNYSQFIGGDSRTGSNAPGPSEVEFPTNSASPRPNSSSLYRFSDSYWTAIAEIDLGALRKAAETTFEIGFAEGLALLTQGALEKAESAFVAAADQLVDFNVAVASRIMLAKTLLYERKWVALRDLSSTLTLNPQDRQHTADLERWGSAFAGLEQQVTTFPEKSALIPLKITSIGTPTIRVRINGKEYDFWFDTGSSITVLSSEVVSEAQVSTISEDTLQVRTFGGSAPVRAAVVKRVDIGAIVLSNVPAVVMDADLMRLEAIVDGRPKVGLNVDGIIGWDTIRQFDVSIDYSGRTIKLARPDARAGSGRKSRNLAWVGKPLVEVRTKLGRTLHFTIDTGAQISFVNAEALDKTSGFSSASVVRVFGFAETGSRLNRLVRLLTLDLAGTQILLRDVPVYGSTSSGFINCDGILGSDIGQFGIVRIDATNGIFSVGAENAAE